MGLGIGKDLDQGRAAAGETAAERREELARLVDAMAVAAKQLAQPGETGVTVLDRLGIAGSGHAQPLRAEAEVVEDNDHYRKLFPDQRLQVSQLYHQLAIAQQRDRRAVR